MPGNFDTSIVDEVIQVRDEDSVNTAKQLLKTEAMFVGSSSGCIAFAALEYARSLAGKDKNIVAILPDGGRGYISTIYDDAWLKTKLIN